jgi:hypothetical protein
MKKLMFWVFLLSSFSLSFSQNLTSGYEWHEEMLIYQDELDLWLKQNEMNTEYQTQIFNDIELFKKPYLSILSPPYSSYGKGAGYDECNAVGKFLTIYECEKIYEIAYLCIPEDDKGYFPFRTFDNFRNSIIFNPKILFSFKNVEDIDGEFVYLIFIFGRYMINDSNVNIPVPSSFDVQLEQLRNGDNKEILITPAMGYLVLFKINNNSEIELVLYDKRNP